MATQVGSQMFPRTPYQAGDPASKILILGQAPSNVEIYKQEPLVGPAGTIFNECLMKAKLSRGELYILNLWEDQVYTDKMTQKISSYKGGPVFWHGRMTAEGHEASIPTLRRIAEVRPNVIVALGQQALEAVTGINKGIMKWRGSILWSDKFNCKVIPTVHPAAVLHGQYIWKYLIINDLEKAKRQRDFHDMRLPARDILIRPSFDEVMDGFSTCRKAGILGSDLEIINMQVACFCLCPDKDRAVVVPTIDAQGDYWSLEEETKIWQEYSSIMGDPEILKINQNLIGFDAPFLLQHNNIITRGPIGDTMVGYARLYPEFPKSLGFLGSIYTDEPYWKDEGKMWRDIDAATGAKKGTGNWEQFWRYNGKDGCVAIECWWPIEQELLDTGFWNEYQEDLDMVDPVLFMSVYGLRVDQDEIKAELQRIDAELVTLEAELNEAAGQPLNANSSKQCIAYFYGTKGLRPYLGKTGNPTTDDKALSRIIRKTGLREAKLVQEVRNRRKLKGTYLEVVVDDDGRLRCSWNITGTYTFRFSSSKTIRGTGLNLQNIDPRFKPFIVEDC